MPSLRILATTGGWLILSAALVVGVAYLELSWNFFSWSFSWHIDTAVACLIDAATLIGLWFMSGVTRDNVSLIISAIACVALLGIGVLALPAEQVAGGIFGRATASPLWYRIGSFVVFSLPSCFWLLRARAIRVAS